MFSSILVQDLEVVCNTRKLFSVSYHPSLSEILQQASTLSLDSIKVFLFYSICNL